MVCRSFPLPGKLLSHYRLIESRNDPSPKSEVVHETKFSLKISIQHMSA